MAFIKNVLDVPSYGWKNQEGLLSKPTVTQLFSEFFKRVNIITSRKNWLPFFSWFCTLSLAPFAILFIVMEIRDFNLWYILAGFVYGMIFMGTHGTIWYHRYGTHKAYRFSNTFWRFITANLVIKLVPEELYIVSHHVHHALSDEPGDPYNAECGFLYCFLADANHQPITKNLTEEEYAKVVAMVVHTGIKPNSYKQYLKWGSIAHPVRTALGTFANWIFWLTVFYVTGGVYLTVALLAGAFIWGLGVRTFNYEGHGKGENKQVAGQDYNTKDKSINQWWPGIVAGEWHNNHHLYPASARSGFLTGQIDFAWYYIRTLKFIGGVSFCRDAKRQFMKDHREPYLKKIRESKITGPL